MTLEERTEKLFRDLKEMELAKKLKNSRDKVKVLKEAEMQLGFEFEEFKAKVMEVSCGIKEFIFDKSYKINPEEALEIVLLCVMAEIEDYEMLEDWEALHRALFQVRGEMQEVAEDIAFELKEEEMLFSDFTLEEFVEKFF